LKDDFHFDHFCAIGNFHALLLFRHDSEMQQIREAVHRLVHRAIALDGTCEWHVACKLDIQSFILRHSGTGEHGVGVGKKQFLVEELGDGTIELMRTIKKTIDPHNLFNPGKVGRSSYASFWHMLTPFSIQLYPD